MQRTEVHRRLSTPQALLSAVTLASVAAVVSPPYADTVDSPSSSASAAALSPRCPTFQSSRNTFARANGFELLISISRALLFASSFAGTCFYRDERKGERERSIKNVRSLLQCGFAARSLARGRKFSVPTLENAGDAYFFVCKKRTQKKERKGEN